MNASQIKQLAKEFGADLVGIAPVERLAHLPPGSNPKTLAPNTKSVIVAGHRIMRGTLRGVEEGTNFGSTYSCYGFNWLEDQFLTRTVYNLTCRLEDEGIEAVPVMSYKKTDEKFVPDYMAMAAAAGLGGVGKGGFFLTSQYGHRQRLASIFVDIELDGDKVQGLDLCGGCRACMEACPLHAYDADGKLDLSLCKECRNGASAAPGRSDMVDRYAASCGRACMVALEEKVGNRFGNKFRKRSVWSIGPGPAPVCSQEGKQR